METHNVCEDADVFLLSFGRIRSAAARAAFLSQQWGGVSLFWSVQTCKTNKRTRAGTARLRNINYEGGLSASLAAGLARVLGSRPGGTSDIHCSAPVVMEVPFSLHLEGKKQVREDPFTTGKGSSSLDCCKLPTLIYFCLS